MERQPIVDKFGGTSLANAQRIAHVAEIILSDPNRRFAIPSAPGNIRKDEPKDLRITNLLKRSATLLDAGGNYHEPLDQALTRFEEIGRDLGVRQVGDWLKEVRDNFPNNPGQDWLPSRGEWLNAQILASYMKWPFAEAAQFIRVRPDGTIDPSTYPLVADMFAKSTDHFVIPGYYGMCADTMTGATKIKVFETGGSDLTGAIIAREVDAEVYENWTDVNGLLAADNEIVTNPNSVRQITYLEMRELGNNGVPVLQRNTVRPLFNQKIPINIRNTFQPQDPGTWVLPERDSPPGEDVIAIAHRKGLMSIVVHKFGINEEVGFIEKVADALAEEDISIEDLPTGADMVTLVIEKPPKQSDRQRVTDAIIKAVAPDDINIHEEMGSVFLVGQKIMTRLGDVISRATKTLENAGVLIESISAPQGGKGVLLGVNSRNTERAMRELYKTFIEK